MKLNEVLSKVKAGEDVVVVVNGKETHFRFENGLVVRYGGDCRAYGPVEEYTEAAFLKEFADKKIKVVA